MVVLLLACGEPAQPRADAGSAARGVPLTVSADVPAVWGETVTYTIGGLKPGETTWLVSSTSGEGAGPCLAGFGGKCLGILDPVLEGSVAADPAGIAVLPVELPIVGATGVPWSVQVMAKRGPGGSKSKFSAPLTELPPDLFVSGLAARPANPTCVAPAERPIVPAPADLVRAFPNLTFADPTHVVQGPNGRWYVLEQAGIVRTFDDVDETPASTVFVDLTATVYSGANEMGLLGLAFAPDFETSGHVFVDLTVKNGGKFTQILRYTSPDGGLSLDPASATLVLEVPQPFVNHNGGTIAFGPEGLLYVGMGDGGGSGDPNDEAQDPASLLGKMLRIDVSSLPYGIPADNPFALGGGAPEVYALGLRNPWRWSFDRFTGELWLGDVGQTAWEEVDVVVNGGNYGWNRKEGFACFSDPSCAAIPGLTDPVLVYGHDGGAAIIGGFVYRGTDVPALHGVYLFADYHGTALQGLFTDAGGAYADEVTPGVLPGHVTAIGEGLDGEILVATRDGSLWRMVPPAPAAPDPFPTVLSATGCAEGMIPYAPNASFWSDGAEKERWLAIPDGTTIAVVGDDLDLPIGSVVLKHFRVDGALVETRLLMRHADGSWAGYPYVWRADGADADLALEGAAVDLGGSTWEIPSSTQCLACHVSEAGFTLGLEIGQLNGDFPYPAPGTVGHQLVTLEAIGVLDPLGATPDLLPVIPDPFGEAPLDDRARAYLHTNCAHCHRGPGLDLRYDTPLGATAACGVPPASGDAGVPGALLITPGDPATSVISLRIRDAGDLAMPPLARAVVDVAGADLVDAWIAGLGGCP